MQNVTQSLPFHIQCLRTELERRKLRNPCYSLRAYARQLGLDPSSLSRFMTGKQQLSLRACASVVRKLSLPEEDSRAFVESFAEERRERLVRGLKKALGHPQELPSKSQASLSCAEIVSIGDRSLVASAEDTVATVSHDLRNPLTSILNMLYVMENERAQHGQIEDRTIERSLGVIRSSAERMRSLVTDVLSRRRVSAAKQEGLLALLQEAIAIMRPIAESRRVSIELDLGPGCQDARIFCDRDGMFRMFSNLLGNAVNFSPAGSRVRLHARCDGGEVTFAVSDSGPGIPEAHWEQIFERHWQGDPERSDGAGLGLSIVRDIVRGHDGKIWVESQLGSGSTFFVRLPAAEAMELRERIA